MKVIAVYDNGGKTMDRFTVVMNEKEGQHNMCLGMSLIPNSPQGFCQWSSCTIGDHLGNKINIDTLPENVQNKLNSLMEE